VSAANTAPCEVNRNHEKCWRHSCKDARVCVAPVTDDEKAGIAWWNGLTNTERAHWLKAAQTAVPAVAWRYFQRQQRPGVAAPTIYPR